MTVKISPEEWAQVRYKYEHTDERVDDICLDHRISANTLRDRVRRWGWTPRHEPVAAEGPPPMLPVQPAAPLILAMTPADASASAQPMAAPPGDSAAGLPAPFAPAAAPPDGTAALPAAHAVSS